MTSRHSAGAARYYSHRQIVETVFTIVNDLVLARMSEVARS